MQKNGKILTQRVPTSDTAVAAPAAGNWWPLRHEAPGAAILHPACLASLVVLAFNDHVIKRYWPGVLSGKLSDFAAVVLLPLFLQAAWEVTSARIRGAPPSALSSNRVLKACVALTLAILALPEVWPAAETAYRYGFGVLHWPFRALAALFTGGGLPGIRPVQATADVTDLVALPMGYVAYAVGRRANATSRAPLERA